MAALSTDSSADEDSYVSDGDSYADADAEAYGYKKKEKGFQNSFDSFPEPTFSPCFKTE